MNKQDQLEELLVDWEQQRRQGNELSVAELCREHPDLAAELSQLIADFKATDWLEDDDPSQDDFLPLPDFSTLTGRADDTRAPAATVTLDQFCERLVESGLMEADDVGRCRQLYPANDAISFVQQLVNGKKLTRFQATVLQEEHDLPLVLDRYVILDEIGAGGMGTVYKALHQQMDRIVALKILPRSAVDSVEKVRRFQREVKAAARLHHQNIVVAHDARMDKGVYFLVMEMVDGQDLSKLVRRNGPLSIAKAVQYTAQAARGLDHAHGLGIVHRDIKPANLLLDTRGVVKILDMGLARIENTDAGVEHTVSQELTQAGMVMGTIAYLAPEQALDTRYADARSDIYSLGCTLYFLLTGKLIYSEDTMMKTIMAHREKAIPSLCSVRAGATAELDAIFQKMVAKQPADRFQSAAELIAAFDALEIKDDAGPQSTAEESQAAHDTARIIDTGRDTIEPTVIADSGERPTRRWPLIAAGVLGLLVLMAGLVLKLQTPAGTVILEIDQPELIGAVVTIDGEQKITIKTGAGKEPIEVTPDQERHLLEVRIAGYKTFSKEFSFETGNQQSIKVRLEPLEAAAGEEESVARPDVASLPDHRWALEFDGQEDFVELSTLKIDAASPLTFEAWCTITPGKNLAEDNLDPLFISNTLSEQSLGNVLIYTRAQAGYWMAAQMLSNNTAVSTQLYSSNRIQVGQVCHIAAVWNGSEHGLFYDGVLVDRPGRTAPPIATEVDDRNLPPFLGRVRLLHTMAERYLQGIIEEVRISRVARYTSDFKPERRFENDDLTLALYHFEEGQGDVLRDASGKDHHGRIRGARWVKVDNDLRVVE